MNDRDASTHSSLEVKTAHGREIGSDWRRIEIFNKIEKRIGHRDLLWKQKCRVYENKSLSSLYNQMSSIDYTPRGNTNIYKMNTVCKLTDLTPNHEI